MSARVFNPMVMSEMRRMLTAYENNPRPNRNTTATPPDTSELARVRRDLFGPVDHEDNRRFVDRELAAQQTRDADRWGFDFVRESPRKSGPGTARYSWEKVVATETVPEPYALRRLPYLQSASVDESTAVGLLPSEESKTQEDLAASIVGDKEKKMTVAKQSVSKQRRITDYLQVRKRSRQQASSKSSSKTGTTTAAAAVEEPRAKLARTTPS